METHFYDTYICKRLQRHLVFQSCSNVLQAVLAVIKALLHRGKVKLATPKGDLHSHQAVIPSPQLNPSSLC